MSLILGVLDTGNTLILRRIKGKGATYTVITYYLDAWCSSWGEYSYYAGNKSQGDYLNYEENIPPASFVLKLEEYYYSTGNKRQGD